MVKPALQRGDVWLVSLDPTLGAEIKKTRPCLVVSPLEIHGSLRTALVAPLTSKGFSAPFRISVEFDEKSGLVLLDQIRAVDKLRLVKRLGAVQEGELQQVLEVLQELFAP
ncbi:type II toxin-antitoxin system PemK/MazF family toxin [Zoogloea sp.]|uniref:type II toxin-antitoxin system PemK/MazF family toxin n=1 Tax=Zoogloea sp. TaxID=49181 RepID=UPI0025FBFE21|nr:type II toxin-antitoxin system PemK/MazF family toxin [Zoogloea sp.]MCK6394647.1 type II toxin-antitoxin system PemK/MazF family toxin [Zoogloea sp.]